MRTKKYGLCRCLLFEYLYVRLIVIWCKSVNFSNDLYSVDLDGP